MKNHAPMNRHSVTDLIATLDAFDLAGIDPAFDAECEELERQFAELRFVTTSNA
jgi:hypothetical protein